VYLTSAAPLPSPAPKESLQVPFFIDIFTSGTAIALYLAEHRRRTEVHFGGGCPCIAKEQELIAQQQ
jgi:hypothetical protein